MAKSKDDILYGTAQARLTEDDSLRVAYKADTPLEAGKIADSDPVDLSSSAHNIQQAQAHGVAELGSAQPQMNRDEADHGGVSATGSIDGGGSTRRLPKKNVLSGSAP